MHITVVYLMLSDNPWRANIDRYSWCSCDFLIVFESCINPRRKMFFADLQSRGESNVLARPERIIPANADFFVGRKAGH